MTATIRVTTASKAGACDACQSKIDARAPVGLIWQDNQVAGSLCGSCLRQNPEQVAERVRDEADRHRAQAEAKDRLAMLLLFAQVASPDDEDSARPRLIDPGA